MLWHMLRAAAVAAAETAGQVAEEAGTLEVEQVEQGGNRVQISTAAAAVEAEAKEPWWPL